MKVYDSSSGEKCKIVLNLLKDLLSCVVQCSVAAGVREWLLEGVVEWEWESE